MRKYCAVGNRCAVDFASLNLPLSQEESMKVLREKRFQQIEVDMVGIAEGLVGRADWKLPSGLWEAPHCFDCSSLTKWLYAQRGILIPRRPIQQYEFCREFGEEIPLAEIKPCDLLFVDSPFVHGVRTNRNSGIGHVCFVSAPDEVICATNSEFGIGVVKVSFSNLFANRAFCAAGRIIPQEICLATLLTPPHREVESSDDVKWVILQSLMRQRVDSMAKTA